MSKQTKFVLLGDTHLGARAGSAHFATYFNRFFSETLYPYMLEHGIKDIIQLGDLFDNRTSLSVKAYHMSKAVWFDALREHGFTMHVLIGNHDINLRESLHINSPELLLQEYIKDGCVKVYSKPTVIEFDNCSIDVIPWICSSNREQVSEFMHRDKVSDLCVGHFEINGFQMYRGIPGHGGLETDLFARYEATISGHYHTRSQSDNIMYAGTPYEMTWMDAHDPRGFTVFDTLTRSFEFIQNPETMFKKVYYNNGSEVDLSTVTGKFVKLIVEKKSDLYKFDSFLNSLKNANPYDLSILENLDDVTGGSVDENIQIEDTMQIIYNYVDSLTTVELDEKDAVKRYLNSLFVEAMNT